MKDAALKNQGHFKYNQYKNLLSTLRKRRKDSYFTNNFQTNINDLKNTSKYIKKLSFLKRTSNSVPSDVIENIIALTKPRDTANAFTNVLQILQAPFSLHSNVLETNLMISFLI